MVRQVLRRAPPSLLKLAAVRAAVRHHFPTADIDEMNAKIERGDHSPVILDSHVPRYLVDSQQRCKAHVHRLLDDLIPRRND